MFLLKQAVWRASAVFEFIRCNGNPAVMSQLVQRCINGECRKAFGLDEPVYVCSSCGDLLEIEQTDAVDAASLREVWRGRRASRDERDRSGVWRFREFLPFDDDVAIVSLGAGNTQLYGAPRCAEYADRKSVV